MKPDENKTNEPRDYTDKDVRLKPLVVFFIGSTIFVAFTFIVLRLVINDYDAGQEIKRQNQPDFAAERMLAPTNLPRLEIDEPAELAEHRAYEKSLIDNGVTWADAGQTVARIPVTNAMDILLSKNAFPARKTNN